MLGITECLKITKNRIGSKELIPLVSVAFTSATLGFLESPQEKGATDMNQKKIRDQIIRMLKKCVFGTAKNAIKLLFNNEEEMHKQIKKLDLLNVAEIKKGKNNSIEIKFVDRLKALDKLCELMNDVDEAATENALYTAIEKSIASGDKHEE
ncbi:hypothetical protein FACS189481_0410 [Clostridia bacterium]|nr:hypothetical protein FACS189481_0410 [Clostridia bacterium]